MGNIFDEHYRRYDSWYEKNKFAYLSEIEAIKKIVPTAGRGLEIGVGTGRFASALGIKYGVDPSLNMLRVARERGLEVVSGCGEKIPFLSSSFDYVAIIISFCFLKDPCGALKEAYRVLKKGGMVIVGIVDKDSFLGRFYQKKDSIFYKYATFFGAREVRKMLEEAGFSKACFYQTLFKLPQYINSIESPLRGYGKGGFVVISAQK